MTTEINQGDGAQPGNQPLWAGFRGHIIEPMDADYESARRVFNANIDRRPKVIARCLDVTDVIEAVKAASALGKAVAVRCGGHNVAGLGTCDDDFLIDLSAMDGVRVDPLSGRVRVEGGCVIGKLDHATHAYNLGVPMGFISTTGVAGLTLGGGFGHLSRQYGLSCDSLVSADIVTADGQVLVVDKSHHPELFWAIRGGGGNFGVVTSFEFQGHPVAPTISGGAMFWPQDKARELFKRYDKFIEHAPEALNSFAHFTMIPPGPPFADEYHLETMVGLVTCYNGPENEAREVLEPLVSGMAPSIDLFGPTTYPQLQQMFDELQPPGLHHYWKTLYLREMTDEIIDVHLEYGARLANPYNTMHIYPLNGAIHRVAPDETAFRYRDVKYAVVIVGVSPSADGFKAMRAWAREYFDALKPHSVEAGYVNFMMADQGNKGVRAAFGDNYDRLVAVKTQFDPDNLFRINQNIPPSTARA